MFEKTDGEEKQSIKEFWKSYNIMNAIDNIYFSWNEITERSGDSRKLETQNRLNDLTDLEFYLFL